MLRDALAAALILAGSAFCLLAALGLLRFPDTLTRLHAAAKAQSAGLLLVLAGGALRTPAGASAALLLIALFLLLTAPVTAQIVGRVAYRTGAVRRSALVCDELRERLAREGDAPPPQGTGDQDEGK
ncbi:sodium:proton antiporter [Streptomyces sp. CC77]|nr:sodium:proton antiporter [Streptomyces sp. CC77]